MKTAHTKSSVHTIRSSPTTNLPRLLPRTTRKRASVSPINPWSDTRETLLPTVLYSCVTVEMRDVTADAVHVTLPLSCVIQVFIAVAWQREMCLPQCCVATVAGRHSRLGRHRFPLLLRNCRVYRGAAWANPLYLYYGHFSWVWCVELVPKFVYTFQLHPV
jgi:hypothetical protein